MTINLFKNDKGKFQADLATGEVFLPKSKESYAAFLTRVKTYVETELLEDAEVNEFDLKALKRMETAELENLGLGIEGVGRDMIDSIMKLRSAMTPAPPKEEGKRPEVVAAELKAKKEAEKAEKDKAIAAAKAEKAAKAEAVKATKEAEKEAKAKEREANKAAKEAEKEAKAKERAEAVKDLPAVIAEATEARTNIGQVYDFKSFEGSPLQGIVSNVVIDKRVPTAMYRLKLTDGSYKHKSLNAIEKGDMTLNVEATELEKAAAEQRAIEKAEKQKSKGLPAKTQGQKDMRAALRLRLKAEKMQMAYEILSREATEAIKAAQERLDAEAAGV